MIRVDDPARDEAGAREHLEGSRVYEPFACRASLENRGDRVIGAHHSGLLSWGTQIEMAQGSTRTLNDLTGACATTATLLTLLAPGRVACAVSRVAAAYPAARQISTTATSVATPIAAPPTTSSGWCIPRYIRDSAT